MNFKDLYYVSKQIYSTKRLKLENEIYFLCLLLEEGQGYRTPEWYAAVDKVLKRNGFVNKGL
jgi:hypothetical protein